MAITPLTVTIDLNPSYKKIPAVYVSQLDNNLRSLAITVQDGGVNYDVASSGYDVYVEGTKPDKHGFSYDVTDIGGTVVGSVVTVPMQTQMTCVQGMVPTEIVLKSGSDRIGSANFLLVVERAGLDEDTDVSETDIPGYIDGAQRAAEAAEDAKDLAVAAKDTAVAVAASIPADYTTLSNDVDDLKTALLYVDINDIFKRYLWKYWMKNVSHTGWGSYNINTTRSAIGKRLYLPFSVTITTSGSVKLATQYYSSTGGFLEATGWLSSATVPANTYFQFIFNTATVTLSDWNITINESVNLYDLIDALKYYDAEVVEPYTATCTLTPVTAFIEAGQWAEYIPTNNYLLYGDGTSLKVTDLSNGGAVVTKTISAGHGNCATYDSTNKILYIFGWENANIYRINMATPSAPVEMASINTGLTGYLSGAIDTYSGYAYIFKRTSYPDTYSLYDLVVYDINNNSVISTKQIAKRMYAVQDCAYRNGSIYVNWGLTEAHLTVFTTNGDVISDFNNTVGAFKEPEGLCFIGNDLHSMVTEQSGISRQSFKLMPSVPLLG